MKRMKEIVEKYGEEYMLRQLAEECVELAQAALKLIRARRKETPTRESEARERFLEEVADVSVMVNALDETLLSVEELKYVCEMQDFKEKRMYERMLDGEMEEDVW